MLGAKKIETTEKDNNSSSELSSIISQINENITIGITLISVIQMLSTIALRMKLMQTFGGQKLNLDEIEFDISIKDILSKLSVKQSLGGSTGNTLPGLAGINIATENNDSLMNLLISPNKNISMIDSKNNNTIDFKGKIEQIKTKIKETKEKITKLDTEIEPYNIKNSGSNNKQRKLSTLKLQLQIYTVEIQILEMIKNIFKAFK